MIQWKQEKVHGSSTRTTLNKAFNRRFAFGYAGQSKHRSFCALTSPIIAQKNQYFDDGDVEQGFKYGLCVYVKDDNVIPLIEKLSSELAGHFSCSTFCDASPVVLKERNPYYSLLFEQGKVYLVDDYIYEETGSVTKVVELTYESPEYNLGQQAVTQ